MASERQRISFSQTTVATTGDSKAERSSPCLVGPRPWSGAHAYLSGPDLPSDRAAEPGSSAGGSSLRLQRSTRLFRTLLAVARVAGLIASPHPMDAAQSNGAAGSAAKQAVTGPININTASVTDLQTLPGIGAKTAGRIIEYRQ